VFRFRAVKLDLRRTDVEGHGFFFARKLRPWIHVRDAAKHGDRAPDKFTPRRICFGSFDNDADGNPQERRHYIRAAASRV
jgi:hypothetical protein